jgi:hypothetical protein
MPARGPEDIRGAMITSASVPEEEDLRRDNFQPSLDDGALKYKQGKAVYAEFEDPVVGRSYSERATASS